MLKGNWMRIFWSNLRWWRGRRRIKNVKKVQPSGTARLPSSVCLLCAVCCMMCQHFQCVAYESEFFFFFFKFFSSDRDLINWNVDFLSQSHHDDDDDQQQQQLSSDLAWSCDSHMKFLSSLSPSTHTNLLIFFFICFFVPHTIWLMNRWTDWLTDWLFV